MNAPQLPPPLPGDKKSLASQAALASLVAPLVAFAINAMTTTAAQTSGSTRLSRLVAGLTGGLLIVAGLVFAVIALCGMRRQNRRKILLLSLSGLAINGVLAVFAVIAFKGEVKRTAEQRKVAEDIRASSRDFQRSVRDSYDPEKGITNVDGSSLDRLNRQFRDASKKMSGDDAIIMQAMANHLSRVQTALKAYEPAMKAYIGAEVLNAATLKQKSEIEPRRQIVREFLARNADLTKVIKDSEKSIRTDLAKSGLTPAKVENSMKAFKRSADPRNALTLQIRDCDKRLGDATIGALDLLEIHWNKWKYDPTESQLKFEETKTADEYNSFLDEISTAGDTQVKLQGKLVNLR